MALELKLADHGCGEDCKPGKRTKKPYRMVQYQYQPLQTLPQVNARQPLESPPQLS